MGEAYSPPCAHQRFMKIIFPPVVDAISPRRPSTAKLARSRRFTAAAAVECDD